nr:hypothetical protein [Tanacetum cinerariifolium]
MFDQGLAKEITKMKEVFNQMETEVAACFVERKCFTIKKKEFLLKNERLLEHILYQDVLCIAMDDDVEINCVVPENDDNFAYADMEQNYIDEYSKVLELEVELSKKKNMVEKVVYDKLSNRCSRLENRCIFLEIKVQQYKESFQKNKSCHNHGALAFIEFFKINDMKAQLQKKNISISNLKDQIATLKAKSVSDCAIRVNNSNVIAPWIYKLDLPLSQKLKRNREAHVDYLQETKEHADTLRDIVEQARAQQSLDSMLAYACKFTTLIQELLVFVNATCPSSLSKNEKSVASAKTNKSEKVKFEELRKSTSDTPNQADS